MATTPAAKRRVVVALVATTAITSIVSLSVEAIWKPFSNYVADGVSIKIFGDGWTGIYHEPIIGVEKRKDDQEDLAKIPHQRTTDKWQMTPNANDIVRARFIEEQGGREYNFEATGLFKSSALVLALRGPDIGRGAIYLEKTQQEYYRGYAFLCDCKSPKTPAYMICPYVLYKNSDTAAAQAAQADPILTETCESRRIN